jgi:hypothetical protein
MSDSLPIKALHQTPNYGCAGGVCEGRYANIHHAQARRALEQCEQQLMDLRETDPTMYYQADYDVLLERHKVMTERLKAPFA